MTTWRTLDPAATGGTSEKPYVGTATDVVQDAEDLATQTRRAPFGSPPSFNRFKARAGTKWSCLA